MLADAWHDTARDDVAGLQFHLLGEEVLNHGSHHHLGGLAAREVGDKLGVGLLHHGCNDREIVVSMNELPINIMAIIQEL